MASTAACSPLNVFRVRRKRNADPLEALLVSVKRSRTGSNQISPVLYQLATTSEVPDVATIGKIGPGAQLNIIDFDPSSTHPETSYYHEETGDGTDVLSMLNDAVDGDDSSIGPSKSNKCCERMITVNGVPMVSVANVKEVDRYVFDFYWNAHGFDCNADEYLIRPANADELQLYAGGDSESSTGADEDDDSNREDNWRNDYPDEESDDNSSLEAEDAEFDSSSESYADLNHRFGNCGFSFSDIDDYN